MSEKLTVLEWHKQQAVTNFNAAWDLIEKADRSWEDDLQMIHMAHASRFHWGEIGTPLQFSRGEWQISRVYAVLGMFESALFHGKNSLKLCLENHIGDFDLAFAYEAIARAYMIDQDLNSMMEYLQLAKEAANHIGDPKERDYLLSELQTILLD